MKKIHYIPILMIALIIACATSASARPGAIIRQFEQLGDQLNLSTQQTEEIRKLRVAYEESISPLRVQEHQLKARLNLFWLQLTPDTEKIKSTQKRIHAIKFQFMEKETDFRIAIRKVLNENQLSLFLALADNRWHTPGEFNHHPPCPPKGERK